MSAIGERFGRASRCTTAWEIGASPTPDGEQRPLPRDSLQVVCSAILQHDVGPGDEVPRSPGYEDLARARLGHHPSGDVYGHPADVVAAQFDLTGVQADPELGADR